MIENRLLQLPFKMKITFEKLIFLDGFPKSNRTMKVSRSISTSRQIKKKIIRIMKLTILIFNQSIKMPILKSKGLQETFLIKLSKVLLNKTNLKPN